MISKELSYAALLVFLPWLVTRVVAVELNFDVEESTPEPAEAVVEEDVSETTQSTSTGEGSEAEPGGEAPNLAVEETTSAETADDDELPDDLIDDSHSDSDINWPSISGRIVGRGDYFPEENPREPGRDTYFSGFFKLDVTGNIGDGVRYQLSPKAYFDSADRVSQKLEFLEDSLQRPAATFDEAYLAWYPEGYEFIIGKQFVTWGTADAFNPTDVINPRDYLSVPDNFKIGVPAISAFRTGEKLDIQVVGVPFFTPSRLPESDNRWSRSSENTSRQFEDRFGSRPLIIEEDNQDISKGLRSAQGGIQLSSSQLVEGWDLAVNYFHGYYSSGVIRQIATAPTVEPVFVPSPIPGGAPIPTGEVRQTAPGTLSFKLFYPEYDQFGTSFSTTSGDFEIHGEAAYHKTKVKSMDDDYIAYIVGVNHTIDDGLPSWLEKITTVLEYAGEEIIRNRPEDSPFADAGFSRAFTNSVFTKVKFKFNEDTELECGGGVNLDNNDYTVSSSITHSFNQSFEVEVGINLFQGDSESFYGAWDENDRAYVQATFYF